MIIPIPTHCPVCHTHLAAFKCKDGHCIFIAFDLLGMIDIVQLRLYLANKYVFVWDASSSKCFIWKKHPDHDTTQFVLPWMEIPQSIDIDKFYVKVKTWITFS